MNGERGMIWGNRGMIAAVSERLLNPAWGVPEGLHGILWAFMSLVKKWTYQTLENSFGWGFWAFLGLSVCLECGTRK